MQKSFDFASLVRIALRYFPKKHPTTEFGEMLLGTADGASPKNIETLGLRVPKSFWVFLLGFLMPNFYGRRF